MTGETTTRDLNTDDPDFETNLATYGEMCLSLGRKATSVRTTTRAIRNVGNVMGGLDPARWTEKDLQDYVRTDRFSGYKPKTQYYTKSVLKAYWQIMGRHDLLPPNLLYFWKARVAYAGGSNRHDELKAKTPSPAEVEKVLALARDVIETSENDLDVYRYMALYLCAAYGLRRMEVAGLRMCDVDLEAVTPTLHIELSKGDKSRKVFMDIPITPLMWERFTAARSSIVARIRAGMTDGCVLTKLDLLSDRAATMFFIRSNGETGDPATPKSCAMLISRLAESILGRPVNSHLFRHAKAFYLLEVKGLEPHQAKDYLGHSNIQQTLDYSYTGVEDQKAAFEKVSVDVPTTDPNPQQHSAPAGTLDAAVGALTGLYEAGKLSPEAYAAAITALNS